MSELKIDYGDLASAARAARSAASSCRSYQSALERKVSGKLDNLEKGHSGYTSNASYLARQKMSQLSRKAERYDRYSQKLEDFSDKASTTDANVARSMRADAQNFRKRNDMEVGAVEAFFTWLSTTIINSNDFARWLKDAFTDLGNFLDDAWDAHHQYGSGGCCSRGSCVCGMAGTSGSVGLLGAYSGSCGIHRGCDYPGGSVCCFNQ